MPTAYPNFLAPVSSRRCSSTVKRSIMFQLDCYRIHPVLLHQEMGSGIHVQVCRYQQYSYIVKMCCHGTEKCGYYLFCEWTSSHTNCTLLYIAKGFCCNYSARKYKCICRKLCATRERGSCGNLPSSHKKSLTKRYLRKCIKIK